MNGAVLGIPPSGAPGAVLSATDPAIGAFQQNLVNELNLVAATGGARESQLLQAEFNALANDHSLIGFEKIIALQKFGEAQIASREQSIAADISTVQALQHIGGGQRAALISNLQTVSARLSALGAQIAQTAFVDMLRTETLSIATSSNVNGTVAPIVHLASAADSMLAEASLLAQHGQQFNAAIVQNASTDPNHGLEVAAFQDLQRSVSSMSYTANAALNAVIPLVLAPDAVSVTTINNERSLMSSELGSFGALTGAQDDINSLRGWVKPIAVPAAAVALPVAIWGTPPPCAGTHTGGNAAADTAADGHADACADRRADARADTGADRRADTCAHASANTRASTRANACTNTRADGGANRHADACADTCHRNAERHSD